MTFDNRYWGSQPNHYFTLHQHEDGQQLCIPLCWCFTEPKDQSPAQLADDRSLKTKLRSPDPGSSEPGACFQKIKGCWGRCVHSYAEHTNASIEALQSESIRVFKSGPLSTCAGWRCVTWTVCAPVSWGYTLLSSSNGSLPSAPLPCGLWEWLWAPLLCFL